METGHAHFNISIADYRPGLIEPLTRSRYDLGVYEGMSRVSYSAASRIATYLTSGYFADSGYSGSAFARSSGDTLRVYLDFSGGADLDTVNIALDAWTSVTGLNFDLGGTASDNDLRLTDSDSGAYSYASWSSNGIRQSAVVNVGRDWMNAYGTDTVSYYTQTWIHELGHALGLGHAGPYNGSADWGDQKFALDSWQMSVMSYFSPAENPNVEASYGFVLTPMPADILAIQRLYGASATAGGGADIYGFDGTATGIYKVYGDLLDSGDYDLPALITIFDAGGRDMLNLSRTAADQRIDLAPGTFSDVLGSVGTLGIAYGTLIENVRSGSGDDTILGNRTQNRLDGGGGDDVLHGRTGADILSGSSGDDRLIGGNADDRLRGGSGNDILIGSDGADRMWGGTGADRFVFRPMDDPTSGAIDRIMDFVSGEDVLDLRGFGLNRLRMGAVELAEDLLRVLDRGDTTHVRADLDGDGRPDLCIALTDCDQITSADILL